MSTAAEQLRRILHVIPRLADGQEHPVAEIARLVDADPRTLLADLQAMSERYDAPGGFVEGVQITWSAEKVSVIGSDFLRPMRLTISELCALELGLAVLQARGGTPADPAVASARSKLEDLVTEHDVNAAHEGIRHAGVDGDGDERHLALLAEAQRSKRKVVLVYQSASSDEPAPRIVCPYSLVFASGQWYVVASCEGTEGLRFFRIDRVTGVELTAEHFEIPDGYSLEELVAREKMFRAPQAVAVSVRYSANIARWIAEREQQPLAEDGSLILEHQVADMQWLVRHVLQYGPDAEVLAPGEARRAVAEALEAMLA
jgi:proteasome accessory factor C